MHQRRGIIRYIHQVVYSAKKKQLPFRLASPLLVPNCVEHGGTGAPDRTVPQPPARAGMAFLTTMTALACVRFVASDTSTDNTVHVSGVANQRAQHIPQVMSGGHRLGRSSSMLAAVRALGPHTASLHRTTRMTEYRRSTRVETAATQPRGCTPQPGGTAD
jgi:hypothetical protein